jgi:cardiolipin synthase
VHWAPKTYDVTHQKTITVDGDVSAIMTLNLTSEYYATSRDFALIDSDTSDVGCHQGPSSTATSQVLRPHPNLLAQTSSGARAQTSAWSASSGRPSHTLYVENEEMSEYTIVDARCRRSSGAGSTSRS